MADTQRQGAPVTFSEGVTLGNYDNDALARDGAAKLDRQNIEKWKQENENSIWGLQQTIKDAAMDSGSTAWDFVGRMVDSSRRELNAKHKAQGFDYWTDPRRKQWEADLSDDELTMLRKVADRGYADVILAVDRVKRGREFQDRLAHQNGVLGLVGQLGGSMTDPAGLLAGAGVGGAIRVASGARTIGRAAAAAQATLAKPGVAGAVYRALGEGAEQVAGSLLADGAMNVIGEYRSKDDMEMNALASFVLGTSIRGVSEAVSLRKQSGGKTRQAVAEAADESVVRMAETAESPIDLRDTPTEHAAKALADVAADAAEVTRPGRRAQMFAEADQAAIRAEYEGATEVPAPTDKVDIPTLTDRVPEAELAVTADDVRASDPEAAEAAQFVADAQEAATVDGVMETHADSPEVQLEKLAALDVSEFSPASQAYLAQAQHAATEAQARRAAGVQEVVTGGREVRALLPDGGEVRFSQAGSDATPEAHPGLEAANAHNVQAYSHREVLEAVAAAELPGFNAKAVTSGAKWLLGAGDQTLLRDGKTLLDFGQMRESAMSFKNGDNIVPAVRDDRTPVAQADLATVVRDIGPWARASLVHEIVHSMTSRILSALDDPSVPRSKFTPETLAAFDTISAYRQELLGYQGGTMGKNRLAATDPERPGGYHYASKNVHEFVAQAMSDVSTQTVLASMKPLGALGKYFSSALDHVLTSVRDLLVHFGFSGEKAAGRNGFTEAAKAIDILVRAQAADRVRLVDAALPAAPAPLPSPAKTEWAAGKRREAAPTPLDDAHAKYMSAGLFDNAKAAAEAPAGVHRAADFNENLPRNRALLDMARTLATHLPDRAVVLGDRMSAPRASGNSDALTFGKTTLVGVRKDLPEAAAKEAVVQEFVGAALHAADPADLVAYRAAVEAHIDALATGSTQPLEVPVALKAPVAEAQAVFDAAKAAKHIQEDTSFTDFLETALRVGESAPTQQAVAALRSVAPTKTPAATDKMRDALEAQADEFFAFNSLRVERTATAFGKYTSLVSDGLVMARSNNKVMRMLSAVVGETTTGGVAQRQATAAVRKELLRTQLTGRDLYDYNTAYGAWKPSGAGQVFDDVFVGSKRREFDRAVTLEVLRRREAVEQGNKWESASTDPAVYRAATSVQNMAERARQAQVSANTLGSAALDRTSVGYLPQRLDGQKLLAASSDQLRLLQSHLADHWQRVYNWTPGFTKDLARKYVERAVERTRGGTPDIVQGDAEGLSFIRDALTELGNDASADPAVRKMATESGKGLAHTKGRLDVDLRKVLDKDGTRVLDFYVTDPQRLMQTYVDKVSGDIALTEVGILGRPGRDRLMRVLETSSNVTQPELEAARRVIAEIAGETTMGYRNRPLATLRMLTGLARLGGLAWNQLAETMNAAHMLGLDATLKGIPGLPRMIGEVRRIVNGQKVANPWLSSFEHVSGEYGTEGYFMHFPTDPPDARLADYANHSSVLERLLRGGSHLQAKLSLFRAIHGAQHRFVAEQIVKKAAVYLTDAAAGTAKPDRWLRDMGFTQDMIDAAKAHVPSAVTYDKAGNLVGFDLRKMGTYELQADIATAVHRGVAQIIQDSFAGERAAWMHSDVGLFLGQFRTFTATALEKQWARTKYVVGEDSHVAAAYGYMAGLIAAQAAVGAVLHTARVGLVSLGQKEGEDRDKYLARRLSPWELARASLNYSSMSGGTGEIMDLLGVIGGAAVPEVMAELGRSQANGQTPGRGGGGDILGLIPGLGYIRDAGKVSDSAFQQAAAALDPDREVNKIGRTLRDASRLLPGSTLPPVAILLDQLRRLDEAEED